MSAQPVIYRVDGDDGPPISFEHRGLDATGLTIVGRFTKPNGQKYERTAVIDDPGGGSSPALYHIDFQSGDLTEGDHEFDVFISGGAIADFSFPPRSKIIMTVRPSG